MWCYYLFSWAVTYSSQCNFKSLAFWLIHQFSESFVIKSQSLIGGPLLEHGDRNRFWIWKSKFQILYNMRIPWRRARNGVKLRVPPLRVTWDRPGNKSYGSSENSTGFVGITRCTCGISPVFSGHPSVYYPLQGCKDRNNYWISFGFLKFPKFLDLPVTFPFPY